MAGATAAQGGEQIYATLLLSDSYLPGALVLGHSLRDARTSRKLAVLVTLDSVSADAITQLKTVYDYVLPVPRIRNDNPANLYLMNRTDLHSAFTKINLWKQTQFSKIVYIDADVVAYRAPDELFNTPHNFAAAPDIGWPDLFNTGVMVLTPNMGDYYAMMAMAERGISFDGADQGLLNMHFKNNYHRLSFTYNVTPSAHYQYVPAYRHFQSSINMVHFIGSNKPWFAGRSAPHGNGPFDEMVGRWWAVYDRHYRVEEKKQPVREYVQYSTQGGFHPELPPTQSNLTGEQPQQGHHDPRQVGDVHQPSSSAAFEEPRVPPSSEHHTGNQGGHGDRGVSMDNRDFAPPVPYTDSFGNTQGAEAEARPEQQDSRPHGHEAPPPPAEERHEPPPVTMSSWDAQRHPPPADSKPEAMNFPSTHYEMSQDSAHFVPPERYPSPPKDMWYEVPKDPPVHQPRPIFPWESHQPTPSRTFPAAPEPSPAAVLATESPGEPPAVPDEYRAPAEQSAIGPAPTKTNVELPTPTTPTVRVTPADPWTSFSRNNAWDDVPEISRYVDGLQKHRRIKSSDSSGGIASPRGSDFGGQGGVRLRGLKLTDFPSETERPSLPVTPAPIARPSFWGDDDGDGEGHDHGQFPAAEGVPAQSEWDPNAQLQKLARQQYEVLLRKLGGEGGGSSEEGSEGSDTRRTTRVIPKRSLPFGSETARSPTHIPQFPPGVTPFTGSTTGVQKTPGPSTMSAVQRPAPTLPATTKSETSESSTGATLETVDTQNTLLESPMPRAKDEIS